MIDSNKTNLPGPNIFNNTNDAIIIKLEKENRKSSKRVDSNRGSDRQIRRLRVAALRARFERICIRAAMLQVTKTEVLCLIRNGMFLFIITFRAESAMPSNAAAQTVSSSDVDNDDDDDDEDAKRLILCKQNNRSQIQFNSIHNRSIDVVTRRNAAANGWNVDRDCRSIDVHMLFE